MKNPNAIQPLFTLFVHLRQQATAAVALLLFIFSSVFSIAQGNLMVVPKRIVFEGPTRIENLTLLNTGRDTTTYSISFIQARMKEDGAIESINEPDSGQYFADKNIRFFPRSVTLAPKESQVVKLQLFGSGELQPGEYRSHLYLRAEPTSNAAQPAPAATKGRMSAQIVTVFGLSIPAIIRIGEYNADVNIKNPGLQLKSDSLAILTMTLERSGPMSVYGDIEAVHVAPDGTQTPAASLKGLAVYTPNPARIVQLKLHTAPAINYHSGKLQVRFTSTDRGKPITLAQEEIALH